MDLYLALDLAVPVPGDAARAVFLALALDVALSVALALIVAMTASVAMS